MTMNGHGRALARTPQFGAGTSFPQWPAHTQAGEPLPEANAGLPQDGRESAANSLEPLAPRQSQGTFSRSELRSRSG